MVDRVELLREMHQEANEACGKAQLAMSQARVDVIGSMAASAQAMASASRVLALHSRLMVDLTVAQAQEVSP